MLKNISRGLIALVTASNIAAAQEHKDEAISPYTQSCLEEFSKITVDDADAQIEWSHINSRGYSYSRITTISRREDIQRKAEIGIKQKEDTVERLTLRFGIGYLRTPSMQANIRVVYQFNEQAANINMHQARSESNVVVAMQDATRLQVGMLKQAIEVCGLYQPPIETNTP